MFLKYSIFFHILVNNFYSFIHIATQFLSLFLFSFTTYLTSDNAIPLKKIPLKKNQQTALCLFFSFYNRVYRINNQIYFPLQLIGLYKIIKILSNTINSGCAHLRLVKKVHPGQECTAHSELTEHMGYLTRKTEISDQKQ